MRVYGWVLAALVLGVGVALVRAQEPEDDAAQEKPQETVRRARYVEKEIFIPVLRAMPQGLDAIEVYIDTPGRHPLVVLTHGSSVDPAEHAHVTPWGQFRQALWFARRGYVVLVVVRKGYGKSAGVEDGRAGGCGNHGSFEEAGEASATDLREVIEWAAKQPEVDGGTVLSAGVSTGGFAQVALAAEPPAGLRAAISFAGGRGSDGKEHNCNLDGLLHAFRGFGKDAAKHGDLPMLWVYSQNDHYFPPAMAVRFDEEYRKGGGADEFVMAPADGEDGHHLYGHIEAWEPVVLKFLKAHGLLPLGDAVLPPPTVPDVPPPAGLHERSLGAWKWWLGSAPYKAFAMNGEGIYGSAVGNFNQALADEAAMTRCRKAAGAGANGCRVVARTPGGK